MRKLFMILFLTYSFSAYSQLVNYKFKTLDTAEYIVTYSLKFQEDSLNPNNIHQEDMLLFLGTHVSLFLSKNSYNLENELRKFSSQAQLQEWLSSISLTSIASRFGYRIYKNNPKGKITYTEKVIPSLLKYEENLNLFNWKLSEDTATISGYKVQKATCNFGGRSWIAWFSPKIPYNDGPYKFNGLPGLIVKISDTRNQYVFELKSIEKPKKLLLIEFAKRQYIETTKQGFFHAKDAFRNDIVSRARQAGFNSEEQQTAARNMAQRNNPLELKRK